MKLNPESIARASSRHPGRTLGIWLLILVGGIASASTLLAPALTTGFNFTNNPEAKQAKTILDQKKLTTDAVTETFVVAGAQPAADSDPAFVKRVNDLLAGLRALEPAVFKTLPASAYSAPDPSTPAPSTPAPSAPAPAYARGGENVI